MKKQFFDKFKNVTQHMTHDVLNDYTLAELAEMDKELEEFSALHAAYDKCIELEKDPQRKASLVNLLISLREDNK